MTKHIVFLIIFLLFAKADVNRTKLDQKEIDAYKDAIEIINKDLKGNTWLIRYGNYLIYENMLSELDMIETKLKNKRIEKLSLDEINELQKRQEVLLKQIELLKEFKNYPISQLIKPPEISKVPQISNPIAIISGYSYIKQLQDDFFKYQQKLSNLSLLIENLKHKEKIIKLLNDKTLNKELPTIQKEIKEFSQALKITDTTLGVYSKKIEESIQTTKNSIATQIKRAFNIALFIVFVIALSFFCKYLAKRYIAENTRFYMANKIINFINILLIIFILLFSYIDNVNYVVTIVGFASAGIAIAMKDMFMSLLGWIVIVFGGSFHVGDRIKVQKDGSTYVGDIIDISFLKMTVLEDVTYVTYTEVRRAGRVVFVPNNYIFTNLIANYTHMTLKTVWDGIDLTISFDSNYKKAMYLINNITQKYSKGYTSIARKQLNGLRHQYSLKNTNVEPRIFSFLEPHGMTISVWYQTNSYAALSLRSTISAEIIDAINAEDDIKIAFPTQTIDIKNTSFCHENNFHDKTQQKSNQ